MQGPPSPPRNHENRYQENWWLFLVGLLLIVGGIVAFFALRGDGETQRVVVPDVVGLRDATVTSSPETIEMLDVVGIEYPDAVERLLDAGLFPESIPVDSLEERGNVVEQRPEAGASVTPGSPVRIDVSLGSGERKARQVPDMTGLSLADALRVCADAGFTCRAVPVGGPGREVAGQRPVLSGSAELSQIELSTG